MYDLISKNCNTMNSNPVIDRTLVDEHFSVCRYSYEWPQEDNYEHNN